MLRAADHRLARAAAAGLANCGDAGLRVLEQAASAPDQAPAAREQLARLALEGAGIPAYAAPEAA
jgi:hypothetical protein